jgi:hypothetical protein
MKTSLQSALLILVILVMPCAALAADAMAVSSAELINNARQYDGKTVTYEGEVIGEAMPRGGYAWLNVSDGLNAIGVWVKREMARDIAHTGSYRAKGDWVAVTGVFNRACPMHGGDLDIHAFELRRIGTGRIIKQRLNITKRNLSLVLLGLLCLVLILRPSKRS